MSIPAGLTPTFTLTFDDENLNLTQAAHVYVTLSAGLVKVTKSDSALTISAKTIGVPLTQAETLSFMPNPYALEPVPVKIQANWTYSGGKRGGSDVAVYPFTEQLLNRVVD